MSKFWLCCVRCIIPTLTRPDKLRIALKQYWWWNIRCQFPGLLLTGYIIHFISSHCLDCGSRKAGGCCTLCEDVEWTQSGCENYRWKENSLQRGFLNFDTHPVMNTQYTSGKAKILKTVCSQYAQSCTGTLWSRHSRLIFSGKWKTTTHITRWKCMTIQFATWFWQHTSACMYEICLIV